MKKYCQSKPIIDNKVGENCLMDTKYNTYSRRFVECRKKVVLINFLMVALHTFSKTTEPLIG